MVEYRDIETEAPDYQPMEFYSSDAERPTRPSGSPASAATGNRRGHRSPATIGGEESAS